MTKKELRDLTYDYKEAYVALEIIRYRFDRTSEQYHKASDLAREALRKLEQAIDALDLPKGDD